MDRALGRGPLAGSIAQKKRGAVQRPSLLSLGWRMNTQANHSRPLFFRSHPDCLIISPASSVRVSTSIQPTTVMVMNYTFHVGLAPFGHEGKIGNNGLVAWWRPNRFHAAGAAR